MLTASALVGFCFSFVPFGELPIAGTVGCIGVGILDELPPGWVFIGPAVGLFSAYETNAALRGWFDNIPTKLDES